MPLLFQEIIADPGEWGLWQIKESEQQLRRAVLLHPNEITQIDRIKGEERRREFLAARLLLHRMSGRADRAELVKDDDGKPHLADSRFLVSISHTVGYSAAIAHPEACGIDVQRIVPHIRRISRKFVSIREALHLREPFELRQLHLIWSAKEAIYKAYGRRQLDFREHIFIDLSGYDPNTTTAYGRLTTPEVDRHFQLEFRQFPDFVLVAAIEQVTL